MGLKARFGWDRSPCKPGPGRSRPHSYGWSGIHFQTMELNRQNLPWQQTFTKIQLSKSVSHWLPPSPTRHTLPSMISMQMQRKWSCWVFQSSKLVTQSILGTWYFSWLVSCLELLHHPRPELREKEQALELGGIRATVHLESLCCFCSPNSTASAIFTASTPSHCCQMRLETPIQVCQSIFSSSLLPLSPLNHLLVDLCASLRVSVYFCLGLFITTISVSLHFIPDCYSSKHWTLSVQRLPTPLFPCRAGLQSRCLLLHTCLDQSLSRMQV